MFQGRDVDVAIELETLVRDEGGSIMVVVVVCLRSVPCSVGLLLPRSFRLGSPSEQLDHS